MYIAHKNQNGDEQSVKVHCENVAKIAGERAKEVGFFNIAYLCGLLHDMGKNQKMSDDYQKRVAAGLPAKRGSVHHSKVGARYLYENFSDDKYCITVKLLSIAIASHHGLFDVFTPYESADKLQEKMISEENCDYKECVEKSLEEGLDNDYILNLVNLSYDELYEFLIKISNFDKNNQQFYAGLLQRLITSFLVYADHTDTAEFLSGEKNNYIEANSELWRELNNSLKKSLSKFDSNSDINKARSCISNTCEEFGKNPDGIYRLFVPTGAGKTLSSMRYALKHNELFNKNHIFYIAPYMSIIEQNSETIKQAIGREDVLLEHHSSVKLNDDEDERKNYKYLTESWNSPIVVTTFVQFLNSLFDKSISSVKRMQSLVNSVIIIDEVQNIPIIMTDIFNLAINFLNKICGCSIVLCSATQPNFDKAKLPIYFSKPINIVENEANLFKPFDRVKVNCEYVGSEKTTTESAQIIFEKAKTKESTLVIVNTKKTALEIFNQIKMLNDNLPKSEKYSIYHLSTSLCANHRAKIIEKIKQNNKKTICISTRLIEAGVDISFECVFRSACGLDSIAQAAGRCNRNAEISFGEIYPITINENIGSLEDVKKSKEAFLNFYYNEKTECCFNDNDIFDEKYIKKYFDTLFRKYNDEDFDYPVNLDGDEQKNDTLYDMLGVNNHGIVNRKNSNNFINIFNGAYKTAGREFQFIENNTVSVLVPYEKGREYISILESDISLFDFYSILRKSQRYTINIFENQMSKLIEDKIVYPIGDTGVYVLNDGFYNDEIGFTTQSEKDVYLY